MCLVWFHWCIIIVLLAGKGGLLQIPWGSGGIYGCFGWFVEKRWIQTNIIQDSTKGLFHTSWVFFWSVTVDGWNPKQPPGMYKNLVNHGTNYQPQLVSRISAINRRIVNFRSWVPPINQLHPPQRYAAPGRSSIPNSEDGNTAGEAVVFFLDVGI